MYYLMNSFSRLTAANLSKYFGFRQSNASALTICCFKGGYRRIKSGKFSSLFHDVYRLGNLVIKMKKAYVELGYQEAKAEHGYQKRLREIFKDIKDLTLPEYYGTIYTAIYKDGSWKPTILTVSEYIEGKPSPEDFLKICKICASLLRRGIILDLKHENFGKRGGELVYLDEHGIGFSRLPSDWLSFYARLHLT